LPAADLRAGVEHPCPQGIGRLAGRLARGQRLVEQRRGGGQAAHLVPHHPAAVERQRHPADRPHLLRHQPSLPKPGQNLIHPPKVQKREPPSSPCVSPASRRAARTRAPTPSARSVRATPCVSIVLTVSSMHLTVAHHELLDQSSREVFSGWHKCPLSMPKIRQSSRPR